jgi:DNA-binding GntR family transcriptional regulator
MTARRTGSAAPAIPADDRQPTPYERLKQAIVTGELAPGQQLVETVLAQWCQVSRTPVREALTRLEQDGLVLRTDRGLVVRERSPEEILDIYETRIVLEATAARVAATRRSAIDVITLRRIADGLERLDTVNENAMAGANRDFHRALWRATHNESLIDLLTRLDLHLARYPATTLSQPGRWAEANAEHRAILDAIEAQDLALAADLASGHFAKARDLRLELWADSQG